MSCQGPLASFLQDMIVQNAINHNLNVTIVQDSAVSHAPLPTRAETTRPRSSSRGRTGASRWESSPSQDARKRVVDERGSNMPLRRPTRRNSTEYVDKDLVVVSAKPMRRPTRRDSTEYVAKDKVLGGSPPKAAPKKPSRNYSNDILCFNGAPRRKGTVA